MEGKIAGSASAPTELPTVGAQLDDEPGHLMQSELW
jgi:hypothetical protein